MPSDSDGSPLMTIPASSAYDDDAAGPFDDVDNMSQASSADPGSARPSIDSGTGTGPPVGSENQHNSNQDDENENDEARNARQSSTDQHGSKPPWSELKTKAGKERKRLPLACIACRRKKIRCSGEKPACKHCFRSRIPCVYKVTTRKAAPRTDYMAMLDKRLKRMEDRVIKTIPKDESRDMPAIGRSVVKPAPPGQPSRAHKKRSADDAFLAELDDVTRTDRTAGLGPGGFPLSREAKSRDGSTGLLTEGADALPPMEIQEHLAEVFFDFIYGQSYLLLHKPSFMRRLKAGTIPPVLILAVCAVSARFSTHPQLNSEPPFLRGENWASRAASIALSRHDEPNITILTVFLLLGLHEFGTCHGGRSWSFGGQALRMAYALQLHNEIDRDPLLTQGGAGVGGTSQLSFTDREIKRRTMWACFLMDRFNSSGSQRPPIGNEKFLHIQLPIKESHFQMEIPGPTQDLDGGVPNPVPDGVGQTANPKENMGVSAYIIKGIVLWGRIVDYLNLGGKKKDPYPCWSTESGFSQLRRQTEEFPASLPNSLRFTDENLQIHAADKIANQFLFLHIIINQNILFLNQFAIPLSPGGRPPRDMPKLFMSEAGRAAVEAAHQISALIERASPYPLTVPFAGYCAYTASTVHIWGIFSKNAQLEARSKENLRHTYTYLNRMKKYWGMFHYMVESAKDRYRQFADAAIRGTIPTHNGPAAPMFQYGDWFDKYPHGVSRLHWEDPDTTKHKESGDDAVMAQRPDLQSVEDFFASLSPSAPKHASVRRSTARKSSNKGTAGAAKRLADRTIISHQAATATATAADGRRMTTRNSASDNNVAAAPSMSHQSTTTMQQHFQTDADPTASGFPQAAAPYPYDYRSPSFGQSPFDFGMSTDHLPQLDRQFVFGAFAGFDPMSLMSQAPTPTPSQAAAAAAAAAAMSPDRGVNQDQNNNNNTGSASLPLPLASLWTTGMGTGTGQGTAQFDPGPDPDPNAPSGTGEFYQPSAWFLPFNLDPVGVGVGGLELDPTTGEIDADAGDLSVYSGGGGDGGAGNSMQYDGFA